MNDTYKTNTSNADGCIGWDDYIEKDGQEFILLPEGDYNFEVTNFERGYYKGSSKLPQCNKAMITVQVKTNAGNAVVKKDIFMHNSVEWLISAFFRSIGEKKQGERVKMDWNHVIGKKGRAHFKVREYVDREGRNRETNELEYFINYDKKYFEADEEWVQTGSNDDDLPF